MKDNKELIQQLTDALNKSADDYYKDVVVPLRELVDSLKAQNIALQSENDKLKEILEKKTNIKSEAFLTHYDAERYKKMLLSKNQEIAQLKNEIQQLKNPSIGRYTINVKRR